MEVKYEELHFGGDNWNNRSIYLIKETLSVWDRGHKIIIVHPNLVFKDTEINRHNTDFSSIEWDHINEEIEFNNTNSYVNEEPQGYESWSYIKNRLLNDAYNDSDYIRHVAVVEQDMNNNMFVRCIYKAEKDKMFIAVNPLFNEYKPKDMKEKLLRLNEGHIDLKEYFGKKRVLKRKYDIIDT